MESDRLEYGFRKTAFAKRPFFLIDDVECFTDTVEVLRLHIVETGYYVSE